MNDQNFTPAPRARRPLLAAAAALLLLTLAAFEPVRDNEFLLFDDNRMVTGNTVVLQGLTRAGTVLAFTRAYAANWHPLTWLSHMLDVELFGLDPRGHHLVSLGIHAAAALALMLALRAMTGRLAPSFLAAALFAIHPLRVESVAWVAERKDVLFGLFWMLGLAAWARYARRPSVGRYLPVLLAHAAALMAKPMAVTFPLVLLAVDWWPLGRLAPRTASVAARRPLLLLIEKLPLLALSVAAGVVAIVTQRMSGAMASLEKIPVAERLANAALSLARYLVDTAWPTGLAVFYPYVHRGLLDPAVLAAVAALACGAVLLGRRAARAPWAAAGALWYLIGIAPVLGLLQVGRQAMADRFTYVPLAGVFIALAWAADDVARRHPRARVATAAGAAALLLLLVPLTRRQVALWHDGVALFGHAVRVTEGNAKAVYNLGLALEATGDGEGAVARYREAALLDPGNARVRNSLGLLLRERGEGTEALRELAAAVRLAPAETVMRMTLALALADAGRTAEAIAHLRELVRLRPDTPEALNNLAVLLAEGGEREEAERLLRRALEIDPAYRDARANLKAIAGEGAGSGPGEAGARGATPTTHRRLFGAPVSR